MYPFSLDFILTIVHIARRFRVVLFLSRMRASCTSTCCRAIRRKRKRERTLEMFVVIFALHTLYYNHIKTPWIGGIEVGETKCLEKERERDRESQSRKAGQRERINEIFKVFRLEFFTMKNCNVSHSTYIYNTIYAMHIASSRCIHTVRTSSMWFDAMQWAMRNGGVEL